MKLEFREKFSLEIPLKDGTEEVITGTIREFTKAEKRELETFEKDIKAKTKTLRKKANKLDRLNESLERQKTTLSEEEIENKYNEIDALDDEVSALTDEIKPDNILLEAFRKRFELTIDSDKKDRLKQICEDFGYEKVFKVIYKDIEEKKPKE